MKITTETYLQIADKIFALTPEERVLRLKKLTQHTKDCSDIGIKPDMDIWAEINALVDLQMMMNGLDGTEDGDNCDGCDNEFCDLRQ